MAEPAKLEEEFEVGGVRLPRPFKLLRLGHFGVNATDPEAARDFYCRILGFRVSDPIDFGERLPPEERGKHGPGIGYFTRHGGDHHSLVLFPRRVMSQVNPHYRKYPELTVNQMTWQVSSLREVVDGSSGSNAAATRCCGRDATCPARTGTSIRPIPTGISTRSTTASSRSAGTAI